MITNVLIPSVLLILLACVAGYFIPGVETYHVMLGMIITIGIFILDVVSRIASMLLHGIEEPNNDDKSE